MENRRKETASKTLLVLAVSVAIAIALVSLNRVRDEVEWVPMLKEKAES
ncbi:MAG: hypothetical protein AAF555_00950 [Verrucomicrobiota bacterium]